MLANWDRQNRVAIYPCQDGAARQRWEVARRDCEKAAWAVAPESGHFVGAAALNKALAVALGSDLLMALYQLPVVQGLQDWLYRLIARWRHRLPGVKPYCERFPERCRSASG